MWEQACRGRLGSPPTIWNRRYSMVRTASVSNGCSSREIMIQIGLASTVSHAKNPVTADVAGETVLMSLERNRCYGLGVIGSEVWKRMERPVRVSDLVAGLTEDYEAAPETIERDVLELLTQLADEGLLLVE